MEDKREKITRGRPLDELKVAQKIEHRKISEIADEENYDLGEPYKRPEIKMKKSIWNNRVVRSLTGRNAVGKVLFSMMDVLPVPNVHEIVKSVVKDSSTREVSPFTKDVIKEILRRVDITRSLLALAFGGMVVYVLIRIFG